MTLHETFYLHTYNTFIYIHWKLTYTYLRQSQGDKIGRIFAFWVIVCFGIFS
jgi:hypothetical protein